MFAKAGRKRAVENFDIDEIVGVYERHYERSSAQLGPESRRKEAPCFLKNHPAKKAM